MSESRLGSWAYIVRREDGLWIDQYIGHAGQELEEGPWPCRSEGTVLAGPLSIEELLACVNACKDMDDPALRIGILRKALEAARQLCDLYFSIAADAVGEDEVRKQRDAAIEALGDTP